LLFAVAIWSFLERRFEYSLARSTSVGNSKIVSPIFAGIRFFPIRLPHWLCLRWLRRPFIAVGLQADTVACVRGERVWLKEVLGSGKQIGGGLLPGGGAVCMARGAAQREDVGEAVAARVIG